MGKRRIPSTPKVFYDTNVLLDILLKREPFYFASFRSLNSSLSNITDGAISAISVSDIFYISRKMTNTSIIKFFTFIRSKIEIAPTDGNSIDQSLISNFRDMEDAIQYYTAVSWGATHLLTRNVSDFSTANMSVARLEILTPTQFLELTI